MSRRAYCASLVAFARTSRRDDFADTVSATALITDGAFPCIRAAMPHGFITDAIYIRRLQIALIFIILAPG